MSDDRLPIGWLFGDGSPEFFERLRNMPPPVPGSLSTEMDDAIEALRLQTATAARAEAEAQTLAAIRDELLDTISQEEALGGWLAGQLQREQKVIEADPAYLSEFKRFKLFCDALGVAACPAASETVAMFLVGISGQGEARVRKMRHAIAKVHELRALSPTRSVLVKAAMKYASAKGAQNTKSGQVSEEPRT